MDIRILAMAMAGLLCAGLAAQAQPRAAVAEIRGCTDATITGRAQLSEIPSPEGVKQVLVELTVRGLPDGKHGVHIHETANCTPCAAAGGHFDPGPASNPSPDGNHPFHSGDLVNIEVHGGYGVLLTLTSRVTLSPGPLSIFDQDGSALIIHEKIDTYCPNGDVPDCAGGGDAPLSTPRCAALRIVSLAHCVPRAVRSSTYRVRPGLAHVVGNALQERVVLIPLLRCKGHC